METKKKGQPRDVLLRASRSRHVKVVGYTHSFQPALPSMETKVAVNEKRMEVRGSTGKTYIVTLNRFQKDGNHQCSCPDWKYRRGANGKCKHIMAAIRTDKEVG